MKRVERHNYSSNGKDITATRTITFKPFSFTEDNIYRVMELIKQNLSPEMLKGKRLKFKGESQYYGHCYHSTHTLFLMMDTNELVPMSGKDYRGENHWWIQHGHKIYDPTVEQYQVKDKTPPYDKGKKSTWYGWKKRPMVSTMNLIKKISLQEGILIDDTNTVW